MRRVAVLVAAIVLVADLMTKWLLATPPWGQHYQNVGWQLSAAIGLLIPLGMMFYPQMALSGGLLFAGLAGNLLDSVSGGGVNNPLAAHFGGRYAAFNLADVSIVIGIAATSLSIGLIVIRDFEKRFLVGIQTEGE